MLQQPMLQPVLESRGEREGREEPAHRLLQAAGTCTSAANLAQLCQQQLQQASCPSVGGCAWGPADQVIDQAHVVRATRAARATSSPHRTTVEIAIRTAPAASTLRMTCRRRTQEVVWWNQGCVPNISPQACNQSYATTGICNSSAGCSISSGPPPPPSNCQAQPPPLSRALDVSECGDQQPDGTHQYHCYYGGACMDIAPVICTLRGDPHVVSFDGARYGAWPARLSHSSFGP